MKLILAALFLLTAMIYASVGFGGGSSYTAMLAVSGAPFTVIPVVALACNICVVSGNSWRYRRAGLIDLRVSWPLFVISVPAAWLGGTLHVSETIFIGLLSAALFIAGLRLALCNVANESVTAKPKTSRISTAIIGGFIGFFSGIVGIGGGVFLAPILYRLRWGSAQQIAAICSVFIFVNSVSGLLGHLSKFKRSEVIVQTFPYWPLLLAVIIGGALGNHLGLKVFSQTTLRRVTGVLILSVALRLALRWFELQ